MYIETQLYLMHTTTLYQCFCSETGSLAPYILVRVYNIMPNLIKTIIMKYILNNQEITTTLYS